VHEEIHYTEETVYGNPIHPGEKYSSLSFGVSISRPASIYPVKILIPVIIVEIICFVGFWTNIRTSFDTRIGTASGVLLAAIFLQLSFEADLPKGIELTIMDYHYVFADLVILFVIIETTIIKILDIKLERMEQEIQELEEYTDIPRPLNEVDEHEIELDENSSRSQRNLNEVSTVTTEIQILRRRMETIDSASFMISIILCPIVNIILARSNI